MARSLTQIRGRCSCLENNRSVSEPWNTRQRKTGVLGPLCIIGHLKVLLQAVRWYSLPLFSAGSVIKPEREGKKEICVKFHPFV